jgi:hypothetical protein
VGTSTFSQKSLARGPFRLCCESAVFVIWPPLTAQRNCRQIDRPDHMAHIIRSHCSIQEIGDSHPCNKVISWHRRLRPNGVVSAEEG